MNESNIIEGLGRSEKLFVPSYELLDVNGNKIQPKSQEEIEQEEERKFLISDMRAKVKFLEEHLKRYDDEFKGKIVELHDKNEYKAKIKNHIKELNVAIERLKAL